MRWSSPRRSTPVPSAAPPPSTRRHRRRRSCSEHAGGHGASRGASPSISRTVARPGGGPGLVDVVAHRRRPVDLPRRQQAAELAALGRLEGAERAPQQGHDVLERVGAQGGDPAVDGGQQLGVVQEHGAAAGEEALDERRAAAGRGARRQGATEAGLDRRRRPVPGVVQQPGGPALHQPVRAAPLGERLEHGRQLAAPSRVVDDGERRLGGAQPVDHLARPASSSSDSAARASPAMTRTTSSSNTTRRAATSVRRTSP